MPASVAMGNKKTFRGSFGKIGSGIGMGVNIQMQALFFTQYKLPLVSKVSSIYYCQTGHF